MLTILLDSRKSEPLYQQICRAIRREIAQGRLQPNEKLPSRRALSAHLQTSLMTVQTAYEQLTAEGYLYARPRAGYFVDPDAHLLFQEPDPLLLTSPIQPEPVPPKDQINFSTSGVDLEQFPFATWAKLSRQVLSTKQETLLHATPAMGLYPLRRAISAHLREFRGIHAAPEQILVGAGTEYLLGILVQLLGASRRYAVEEPGYPKGKHILRSNGASVIGIPMDQSGLKIQALRQSGATIAHVTPSHQFPTGIIMPVRRRAELLEWSAEQPERYLIEDDYDSEFRFVGRPIPTLQSIDDRGRVIYLNTFSQTISPSMRLGFLVLPPRLLERYRQELGFYACTVPALEQHVLARFIAGGHYERHLSRMRKEYRDRRSATISAFRASPLASHVTFSEEGAGLHFLLRLDTNRSDEELRRLTAEAGIRLSFLSEYAAVPDPRFAHTLVVNYAGLSQSDLEEALRLLTDVLLPLLA